MSTDILAPGTGAANSADFAVRNVAKVVMIYPEANIGSDTGLLVRKAPDGTYVDVYDDGTAVSLSATKPQAIIYGSGTYRLEFSGRTAAIGATAEDSPAAS